MTNEAKVIGMDPPAAPAWLRDPSGPCANCGQRPATTWWCATGGGIAITHGEIAPWCEQCAVEAQLAHARAMLAAIPALEARLAVLRLAEPDGKAP